MQRKDKEITDIRWIEAVLQSADVCRIACAGNNEPYIVPVCFGYERGSLWFHSAHTGRKIDILRKNPRCCFEVETGVGAMEAEAPCDRGMRYQSVIGTGSAHILEDPKEKCRGLACIVAHYSADPAGIPEASLRNVAVVRIAIEKMTGKSSGYKKDQS
jgi:hypothetical protein